jgi:hypothetical protein
VEFRLKLHPNRKQKSSIIKLKYDEKLTHYPYFLFLFLAFRADEKIIISGFVYDQKDGKPIIVAEIKAKSNNRFFTNADQNGAFKLSASKTEKFILVSSIGFKLKEVKITN